MCGIAGFVGQFDESLLGQMAAAMHHRGPDGFGQFFSPTEQVGLAHRRLSIIDLNVHANQPMWDESNQIAIIYNGEIYNYLELRHRLEGLGHCFKTQSDTEVLLKTYAHFGHQALEKLNGIFAFAIYDKRKGEVFIARDGIGVKPLYYASTAKGVLFASELKSLVQCSELSREIDFEAVHNYVNYLWCPSPQTMFKSVKKLKPGHAMVVKDGQIARQWQFYELPFGEKNQLDERTAIEQTRFYLEQAVQRQMVADVPVGAFLSGGLDSSAVVSFAQAAARQRGKKLSCFTIGFEGALSDEGMAEDLPYAKKVAKHLDVDLHVVKVGSDAISMLQDMVYQLDEPQADPAPINVFLISRLAREAGMKVMLSGAGGDDIFSGYRRHLALSLEKYWSFAPKSFRQTLKKLTLSLPQGSVFGRRVAKAFQYADLDGNNRIASYFNWISPEILNRLVQNKSEQNPLVEALDRLPDSMSALDKMLFLEAKYFLADHNLNYTDKMGMKAGVEIRVPLLDPDLVRFAAGLPDHMKQRGSIGKWIFKKSMEEILPNEVIYRPKTGFGMPLRGWMRGPLKYLVDELLSESAIKNRGLFSFEGVKGLREKQAQGRIDATYTLFSLMVIELWCRYFVDSSPKIELAHPIAQTQPMLQRTQPALQQLAESPSL